MANLAARSAAVFSLSTKNLTGGLISAPPAVRGLMCGYHSNYNTLYTGW